MITVFGCDTAREMLPALVDGELMTADQIAVEAHIRWCRTCRAHVEDLRLIGAALRLRQPQGESDDTPELDAIQAGVLSRVSAEQAQSWTTFFREMVEEPHVLWAALGATVGVMACVLLTMRVVSWTDTRASDSLAAIIDALGSPGSDQNPMRLDTSIAPPRLAIPMYFDDSPELMQIPQNDAMFAFATVVTREGRVSDYALLHSDGPSAAELLRISDAPSNLRFAPAQAGSGSPVAVNMVWLLARTTVKGTARPFDFDEFRPRAPKNRRVG